MHDRAKLEAREFALDQRLAELALRVSKLEKLRNDVDHDERKFFGASRNIKTAVDEAARLAGQQRDEQNNRKSGLRT
jgi:hypothetical protein